MKHEALVGYYDRELAYLRKAGLDFAHKYPKIARRLELESPLGADPHVERLLEGVAFLTARIQKKLDDDFSEVPQALLSVIHPQFIAPIPSLSIVQCHLDAGAGRGTDAVKVPKNSTLHSQPVKGTRCNFRTCYDTELWPITVESARVSTPLPKKTPPEKTRTALYLELRCQRNIQFRELSLSRLRFYLHSVGADNYPMYDYLLNDATELHFWDPEEPERCLARRNARDCLIPVGFDLEHGLLPYDARTMLSHRLLLEYFVLPQKFLFFDLPDLEGIVKQLRGDRLQLIAYSKMDYPGNASAVDDDMFRLGCTPIANLFKKRAKPITLSHTRHEYRVVVDDGHQDKIEAYAIRSVKGVTRGRTEHVDYWPFFSTHHDDRLGGNEKAYWYASRKTSGLKSDGGTDLFLSLVNLDFKPSLPASEVLAIEAICSNKDLPSRLPFWDSDRFFSVEGMALKGVTCLLKPSRSCRIPQRSGLYWRLVAQITINLTSILSPGRERENLAETLRLYDFKQSKFTEQQIFGLTNVSGQPKAVRVVSANGEVGFARGYCVELEFDRELFVGSSAFLFASVLERFMGLSVAINSFCKTSARYKNTEGNFRVWPPRAGHRPLL